MFNDDEDSDKKHLLSFFQSFRHWAKCLLCIISFNLHNNK